MNEERIYQERRISFAQAKKALRKANLKRQTEGKAVERFRTKASELVDTFAVYVDEQVIKSPNTGHGCRLKAHMVEISYKKFESLITDFMKEERKLMLSVKEALKEEEE
tara:strand:- start:1150 stop:1476 length:327 start_codon:yes stop_codon:yes gene_type:complete